MGNRAFWLGRTNRKAFKFGGTCAGPGFARGEGEGTEDWDGAVLGWPKERERCDVSLVDCRQVLLCCVHQQVRGRFAVHRRPEVDAGVRDPRPRTRGRSPVPGYKHNEDHRTHESRRPYNSKDKEIRVGSPVSPT